MPLYDYMCGACSAEFSVVKSMADIDNIEPCPACQADCDRSCRLITTAKEFYGEKPEEPFYSVALGKWVKGNRDNRKQAKERGLIEVGNESIEKEHARYERDRERRSKDRWNDYITQRIEVR
jgi:putative FmdB family regulatory protein